MKIFRRDDNYHTYADYLTWSASCGDELINGVAYSREPRGQSLLHQSTLGELCYQVGDALEDKLCHLYIAPLDVRLPKSNEHDDLVDTVVQPDVFIVSDLQKIDVRGVRGAPDWIAEVLSAGTAGHDKIVKLPAYERAGVREVWLVDPIERTLEIYQLESGRYGRATILELKGQTKLTVVPGVTVDWDRAFAKISGLGNADDCGPG